MNFIGNIIWLLIGGIIAAILWALSGLLLCLTIIGIPFGLQCFKIAGFVLWPFGKEIELGHFGAGGLIFNIIWLIVFWLGVCCNSCYYWVNFLYNHHRYTIRNPALQICKIGAYTFWSQNNQSFQYC
jgi:hypothetical protein